MVVRFDTQNYAGVSTNNYALDEASPAMLAALLLQLSASALDYSAVRCPVCAGAPSGAVKQCPCRCGLHAVLPAALLHHNLHVTWPQSVLVVVAVQ